MANQPTRDREPTEATHAPMSGLKGKNYLLVIGIDAYEQCSPLRNAVLDARTFIQVLQNKYQFSPDQTQFLFDAAATRKGIWSAFQEMGKKLKEDDSLVIYYAGHGHLNEDLDWGYWIPVEADPEEEHTFIRNRDIVDFIRGYRCYHVAVFSDSCFSGAFFDNTRDLSQTFSKDPSRWAITSGRKQLVSDGPSGQNSPFARYLTKYLEEHAGALLLSDLGNKVKVATNAHTEMYQTPRSEPMQIRGHEGGEFVFHPKRDEAHDWKKSQKTHTIPAYQAYLNAWPQGSHHEEAAWQIAQLRDSKHGYRVYIDNFPSGKYYTDALDGLAFCEERERFHSAQRRGEAALLRYVSDYPNGKFVAEAREVIRKIRKKEEEADFLAVKEKGEAALKQFLRNNPDSLFVEEIRNLIEEIGRKKKQKEKSNFESAKRKGRAALEAYLTTYPNGLYENEAKQLIWENQKKTEQEEKLAFESTKEVQEKRPKIPDKKNQVLEKQAVPKTEKKPLEKAQPLYKENDSNTTNTFRKKLPFFILGLVFLSLLVWRFSGISESNPKSSTLDGDETEWSVITPPVPKPEMVEVPAGSFTMGCTTEQKDCDSDEKPTFQVSLNRFYMGQYEVTFAEYDRFWQATNGKEPADEDWGRGDRPVINVSWYDAVAYCNWLSKQHGYEPVYTINGTSVTANWGAKGYRLPTEAEWEYAAREGGKAALFGNGKNHLSPNEVNFDASQSYKKPSYSDVGSYRGKTVPVGSLKSPNALQLHDMSGNVWEWCWDWKDSYTASTKNQPKGPSTGSDRVLRGGSWYNYPQHCRVASRLSDTPSSRYYDVGFRLSRTP